jgi:catecholate siderophore receptor
LLAAASVPVAKAEPAERSQQPQLPPVTIDEPKPPPRRTATKPTPSEIRARNALRAAREAQRTAQQGTPSAAPGAGSQQADRDPYADPAAPYKVDRLASPKFTEPVLNTPKSITVLTKELLQDKNATTLKEVARTTAGITIGTGEGGNAFGDRFFIRGFDARNDIFIDGVRDPAVSIRENFFTEQIEILKGPASSFAGRGTTGGAINIVTKQATDRDFIKLEGTLGTDATKRVVLDINKVISPTFAVRFDAMGQGAHVAERNQIFDDRWGALIAAKWTPTNAFTLSGNYIHTDLDAMPDFGVPYYRPSLAVVGVPFTEFGVPRNTFYGFVNRDFQKTKQDIGTLNAEYKIAPDLTVSNKFRVERSLLNYIGTLPENPVITNPNPANWTVSANPQSRFQVTNVIADQLDTVYKFDVGPVRNTTVSGLEISNEHVSRDSYTGLTSEALPGGFNGNGSLAGVNIYDPQYTFLPFTATPRLTGNPTITTVDTKSAYVINTANYNDFVILNGGLRFDQYDVKARNNQGSNAVSSGMFNYNAGIVVKPVPFGSVYAAYATSTNPVGAELDGTSAQYGGLPAFVATNTNQVFSPERNKAAEVGTKWELFQRHLLLTGALFQTEKDNAREAGTVNGVANTVVAGAAYRVRGIDLGVGGNITEQWSMFGGLVLMHSEVLKSNLPSPNPTMFASNVGRPLANIAHQSFNLLTKYKITEVFEVGGQATYLSKIYGGTLLAANQGTQIPAHWRFDAFAEANIGKNYKLKLAVNNIFNERYYDALYQSSRPFVFIAPGRAGYLIAEAKF